MRPPIRILIVGFGDIGERVAGRLRGSFSFDVSALIRDPRRDKVARALGAHPVRGDLRKPGSLQKFAGRADVIFHFAPPPGVGRRDSHTRNLLDALTPGSSSRTALPVFTRRSHRPPRRLIYISTTGVYGDCHGALIDENQPLKPATGRARRRVDAERALQIWGRKFGVIVTILRAPGIYAADRLPLERLRKGAPALAPEDDVFTNHIHADDLARAAIAAMHNGKAGRIYNVVDNSAMPMGEYFDRVADAFALPRPPRLARADAEKRVPPATMSFMRESRRIGNVRLKRELGFKLLFPTVADFLRMNTKPKN
jgi:nucleoside-diphosphate-sugar epimerase